MPWSSPQVYEQLEDRRRGVGIEAQGQLDLVGPHDLCLRHGLAKHSVGRMVEANGLVLRVVLRAHQARDLSGQATGRVLVALPASERGDLSLEDGQVLGEEAALDVARDLDG